MWQKYITRRLAVQVAQSWNFAWGKEMQKVCGVSLNNTLVFRDGKKTDYYVDEKQYRKYTKGLYVLLADNKFVRSFHGAAKLKLENILVDVQNQFNIDLTKLSNQELLKIYRDFLLPNVEQFYIRMWTVFNIASPMENVIRQQLAGCLNSDALANEYLLKLSSALKPNDVLNKKMDVLKLAIIKNKLSKSQFKIKISRLTKKYRHIPMFDFDHEPYTEDHFLTEIRSVRNPKQELHKIGRMFVDHSKDFKLIVGRIKPDKKFFYLLEFLKENVFLRDYRDMIRQKLNLELRKLYSEIGLRLGLSVERVAILTNDEIMYHLKNNLKFSTAEAKRREEAYLLMQKGSWVNIYSGLEAKKKFNKELGLKKGTFEREIRGIMGSQGIARGRVKIIYTNRDLSKIKRGDILVAAMTRQDFVPVMKKAKAIITDEGGVICHAAIIARELKIPAIVGTKNATQILKDGDLVEVDANHGVVKII